MWRSLSYAARSHSARRDAIGATGMGWVRTGQVAAAAQRQRAAGKIGCTMPPRTYDLVIIGGGSAGLVAASTAAALGARVALLDRKRLGGECLWTGCVPSKSLIASAALAHRMAHLADFGLSGHLDPVNLGAVADRVQGVIGAISHGDDDPNHWRARGIDVLFGDVAFRSPYEIDVSGQALRGRAFLICTGSHPRVPSLAGLETVDYMTNDTIFGLRDLPRHLIVVGGGPIGVELAQAFHRLGADVSLVAGERGLLPNEDNEARAALAGVFAREGVTVLAHAAVAVSRSRDGIALHYGHGGDGGDLHGDSLLIAVGRAPNVAGLGLENAGVIYDQATGIQIDAYVRTSAPHIYACGDVAGPYRFTHAAAYQATIAVRNALYPWLRTRARLHPMPWTIFTDPEVAHVGMTEDEARATYGKILVLRQSFARVDRALAEGRPEGFVKLIVSPWKGTILGAHIVGPGAGEMIQEITLAMRKRLGVSALAGTIHVYPTLAIAVQQAAVRFYAQWPLYKLARWPLRVLARREGGHQIGQ